MSCAILSTVWSDRIGQIIWRPVGSSSSWWEIVHIGTEMAGNPARFAGTV